jgi:hypothetical protein
LPPSLQVLESAIVKVQPEKVIVFAADPGFDDRVVLLRLLAGMVKHAVRVLEGEAVLERAAARMSQTCTVVRAGLDYLAADGILTVFEKEDGVWRIAPGDGQLDAEERILARLRLDALLAETAAYRDYFRNAPESALARLVSQARRD